MKLHALFVGIDCYRDEQIAPLNYARADAVRFRQLVEAALHPTERTLRILHDADATRPSILKAIGVDLAAAARPDDIVLIHFAGHGSPELGESADSAARYLVPHDAEYDNLLGTGIDLERDLTTLMRRLRAGIVVVFIDACFSGRAGGRTFEEPNLKAARHARRWTPQLPQLGLGAGRIVIAAADDDEVALESSAHEHGLFSKAIFDTLLAPPPDSRAIAVSGLYEAVAGWVSAQTGGAQNPVMNGYTRLARLPYLVPLERDADQP